MKIWLTPIKLRDIIKVNGFFKSEGFTLIETLVAMMIIAMSLSIIMGLFSAGLKSKQRSREYSKAVFYAQMKMESLLLSSNHLNTGVEDGSFGDGYSWEVKISEEHKEHLSGDDHVVSSKSLKQYRIVLTIKWASVKKGKTFVVQTIKLDSEDTLGIANTK